MLYCAGTNNSSIHEIPMIQTILDSGESASTSSTTSEKPLPVRQYINHNNILRRRTTPTRMTTAAAAAAAAAASVCRYYQVLSEFVPKFILEVLGGAGAIWGFSEACGLRRPDTIWFWRPAALSVGFLFLIRFVRQVRRTALPERLERRRQKRGRRLMEQQQQQQQLQHGSCSYDDLELELELGESQSQSQSQSTIMDRTLKLGGAAISSDTVTTPSTTTTTNHTTTTTLVFGEEDLYKEPTATMLIMSALITDERPLSPSELTSLTCSARVGGGATTSNTSNTSNTRTADNNENHDIATFLPTIVRKTMAGMMVVDNNKSPHRRSVTQ